MTYTNLQPRTEQILRLQREKDILKKKKFVFFCLQLQNMYLSIW